MKKYLLINHPWIWNKNIFKNLIAINLVTIVAILLYVNNTNITYSSLVSLKIFLIAYIIILAITAFWGHKPFFDSSYIKNNFNINYEYGIEEYKRIILNFFILFLILLPTIIASYIMNTEYKNFNVDRNFHNFQLSLENYYQLEDYYKDSLNILGKKNISSKKTITLCNQINSSKEIEAIITNNNLICSQYIDKEKIYRRQFQQKIFSHYTERFDKYIFDNNLSKNNKNIEKIRYIYYDPTLLYHIYFILFIMMLFVYSYDIDTLGKTILGIFIGSLFVGLVYFSLIIFNKYVFDTSSYILNNDLSHKISVVWSSENNTTKDKNDTKTIQN